MPTLRTALNDLASQFANSVLTVIRAASLEDLLAESTGGRRGSRRTSTRVLSERPASRRKGTGGRLARRSPEQVKATLDKVISAVKAARGKGLRAEQIQAALKLDRRELPRVIALGLQSKMLRRKGQKRATVYFQR